MRKRSCGVICKWYVALRVERSASLFCKRQIIVGAGSFREANSLSSSLQQTTGSHQGARGALGSLCCIHPLSLHQSKAEATGLPLEAISFLPHGGGKQPQGGMQRYLHPQQASCLGARRSGTWTEPLPPTLQPRSGAAGHGSALAPSSLPSSSVALTLSGLGRKRCPVCPPGPGRTLHALL